MDPLERTRDRFPILEDTTYLISSSLGAMPREVHEAMRGYTETWATRGVRAWAEGWWELPVAVGDEVAPLIGAPEGTVTMHQNVTIAEQIVLSCFDFGTRRNRIVCLEPDFPSVLYTMQAQERRGAELVLAPCAGDGIGIDEEDVVRAIDDRTALVAASHVLFRSSFVIDIRPIVERAHEVGARVVWDVYQSAGSMPVDVEGTGVDFAVGGCLKWLCGGPGAGFLYVRPDLIQELEPTFTGWQADDDPFAFRPGAVHYRDDVWRFLNGTPHVPSLYACRPGLEAVEAAGVDRIREKSLRLTEHLIEQADQRDWKVTAPREARRRGGTVALDVPHAFEVAKELLARDILIDFRLGAGIRVSPHFYNTLDECDRVIGEIEGILADGAWERHREADRTVT